MLKQLLKIILPKPIKRRIDRTLRNHYKEQRAQKENAIPKIALTEKHIKNCKVVLDRATLIDQLQKKGHVAEIGVAKGEFSEKILHIAEPQKMHLVDIWDSERYHASLHELVNNKFHNEIQAGRVQIHRKLSVDAADDFPDNYFDWIYLDSSHAYDVTKKELQTYAPKMKANGVIAGHDYCSGNYVKGSRYGVIEAVHEFCVRDDWEIIFMTLGSTENQSFAIQRIKT